MLGGGAYFRIYQVYLRHAPGTCAVGTPDVKREPEWPLHGVTCFVVTLFSDPFFEWCSRTRAASVSLLCSIKVSRANLLILFFFPYFLSSFFFFFLSFGTSRVVFLDPFSRKLLDRLFRLRWINRVDCKLIKKLIEDYDVIM